MFQSLFRSACCRSWTMNRCLAVVILLCGFISVGCYILTQRSPIYNLDIELNESHEAKAIQKLNFIAGVIAKAARVANDGGIRQLIVQAYGEVNGLMSRLGYTDKPTAVTNIKDLQRDNPDICQEKYIYDKLSGDYPLFYKGFEMEKCSGKPEFYTILTLVFNFVQYEAVDLTTVLHIIKAVNKLYPKLRVIAAIPSSLKLDQSQFSDTKIIKYSTSTSQVKIWNNLISKVSTKYVYVGRNVVHFTWFDRLERLVREINNLNAYVVGSAIRGYKSGHWTTGCEQSVLQNYTLVYRHGYDRSMEECMFCHHIHGPFVAKTELFKKLPFLDGISEVSSFAMWFLSIKTSGKMTVVCPDSMSFATDQSMQPTTRQDWLGLSSKLSVEKIRPQPDLLFEFGCDEAGTHCSHSRAVIGVGLSHCCLRELSDFLKLVMSKCKEMGLFCEMQEGTILGALKFNGLLPWELDADLTLHAKNYTAFGEKVIPYFAENGYTWETRPQVYQIYTKNWKVELFTQGEMDSEKLMRQGITPTSMKMDGADLRTSESPGLFGRNRYGSEIYKHAQHWSQTGVDSSWKFYEAGKFGQCPHPGFHYCLDQHVADGSIMFNEPVP